MAAPATHILLLKKVQEKYFSDKDSAALIVGTSFPDIRYLEVIERDQTHHPISTLNEVLDVSAFNTGVRFHSLVDHVREDYMKKSDIYSFFDSSAYISQAIKVYEDKVLYERIEDWGEIVNMFDVIYTAEESFGIKRVDLRRWHELLQEYLSRPTSNDQIRPFIDSFGREGMSDEVIRVLQTIKNESRVKEIVINFYEHFETLIQ
jgi:hypothetical protein